MFGIGRSLESAFSGYRYVKFTKKSKRLVNNTGNKKFAFAKRYNRTSIKQRKHCYLIGRSQQGVFAIVNEKTAPCIT